MGCIMTIIYIYVLYFEWTGAQVSVVSIDTVKVTTLIVVIRFMPMDIVYIFKLGSGKLVTST